MGSELTDGFPDGCTEPRSTREHPRNPSARPTSFRFPEASSRSPRRLSAPPTAPTSAAWTTSPSVGLPETDVPGPGHSRAGAGEPSDRASNSAWRPGLAGRSAAARSGPPENGSGSPPDDDQGPSRLRAVSFSTCRGKGDWLAESSERACPPFLGKMGRARGTGTFATLSDCRMSPFPRQDGPGKGDRHLRCARRPAAETVSPFPRQDGPDKGDRHLRCASEPVPVTQPRDNNEAAQPRRLDAP